MHDAPGCRSHGVAFFTVLWLLLVAISAFALQTEPESDNIHVVFIGDSLLRYQYLALAYLLEYGVNPGEVPDTIDPTWEGLFSTFEMFYAVTNSLFGSEACDCHRPFLRSLAGFNIVAENRYYSNKRLRVRATYLQWIGRINTLRGHAYGPQYPLRCAPGACPAPFDWQTDIKGALAFIVPPLQPTHVIVNLGFWVLQGITASWPDVCTVSRPLRAQGVTFLWATTTPMNNSRDLPPGHVMPDALGACGWHAFDRYKFCQDYIPSYPMSQVYMDACHFTAPMYGHLNRELLHLLQFNVSYVNASKQPPMWNAIKGYHGSAANAAGQGKKKKHSGSKKRKK